MDVAAWLRGLGLEQYAPAFRDNDVDSEALPQLTVDDLIGIGVTSVSHRRKLLAAIALLGAAASAAAATVAPRDTPAPETRAAFARARELASQVEDVSERFSAYYGLWGGHLTRAEPAPMREMAELFLREATARPDCPERLIAHRVSGCTCFQFGDFAGAHQHFQKTIELYDQARHAGFSDRFGQDPRASAEILDALAFWVLGRVDDSLRLADRALADAKSTGHAPTMAHALAYGAFLGLFSAQTRGSRDLQPSVPRYRVPIRSSSLLGRHRVISAMLGKAVRRFRRVAIGRGATRPRHLSGAR
jgi:hypothetical protein